MGTSKDMDMSPFECARKLLDAANMRMSTTARCVLCWWIGMFRVGALGAQ